MIRAGRGLYDHESRPTTVGPARRWANNTGLRSASFTVNYADPDNLAYRVSKITRSKDQPRRRSLEPILIQTAQSSNEMPPERSVFKRASRSYNPAAKSPPQ
jgi:hypothetical protein